MSLPEPRAGSEPRRGSGWLVVEQADRGTQTGRLTSVRASAVVAIADLGLTSYQDTYGKPATGPRVQLALDGGHTCVVHGTRDDLWARLRMAQGWGL